MNQKVVRHPSHQKVLAEAGERFSKLRKQHDAATNRAWLGALVTFTDHELNAINDLLCPNDYSLLKLAGRKLEMPKALRDMLSD